MLHAHLMMPHESMYRKVLLERETTKAEVEDGHRRRAVCI